MYICLHKNKEQIVCSQLQIIRDLRSLKNEFVLCFINVVYLAYCLHARYTLGVCVLMLQWWRWYFARKEKCHWYQYVCTKSRLGEYSSDLSLIIKRINRVKQKESRDQCHI